MEQARYSRAAIALHWLIAAALAFQIALGWRMDSLTAATGQFHAFQLHKSIGITILLLSLARLIVRLWKPRPAPHGDQPWARWLAGLVHFGLYLFMIGAPLTGWLIVSTSRIQVPTLLYGIVPWPHIPGVTGQMRAGLHEFGESAHSALAWTAVALFLLHVAGAIRHQWLLRQTLIERMLPGGPLRLSPAGGALIYAAALALVGGSFILGGKIDLSGPAAAATAPSPAVAPAASNETVETTSTADETPPGEALSNDTAPVLSAAGNDSEAVEEKATAEPAEAPAWTLAPGGKLGFTTSFSGAEIEGSFARWSADIRFDPDALDKSRIIVRVDMASVNTDDASRDETLRGENFFAAGSHAQAVFRSSDVNALGRNRYRAAGHLTLRGIRQPVILNFTLSIKDGKAEVQGSSRITRGDFNVGTGEWEATDRIPGAVSIDFDFDAIRKD